MQITPLTCPPTDPERQDLATLLRACVEGGASIGFVLPLPESEVAAYWTKVFADATNAGRAILVARADPVGPIVGAAQVAFESRANGRHRAEVQKVMVLPSHRRQGIAARLMEAVETTARARGVKLLFLDTSEGAGGAVRFYESLGYIYVGGIPGYAIDPDGTPAANAIFYKTLGPGP